MRKFRFCILDWNGTLQDDLHHIYECGVQRIFRHYGLACPTVEEFRHEVAADFMTSFYWPHGVPAEATAADLNAIMAEGFKEKGTPPGLFPDAALFVETLAERGYPMVVASGYASAKLDAAVARSGLGAHFGRVLGDVRDKPAAFADLMEEAGVEGGETIVVGDTVEDIQGALAVGATPLICTRGFHPLDRLAQALEGVTTYAIAPTLTDLLPHLP
jgi:phosphoglycolate phosphatase-like HAD superfamily hydrolase